MLIPYDEAAMPRPKVERGRAAIFFVGCQQWLAAGLPVNALPVGAVLAAEVDAQSFGCVGEA